MSVKLYEIPAEIERFEDKLINGGGELTPELEAEWSAFVSQGKDRLEAAAFVINRIKGDVAICDAEIDRLSARVQSGNRNVDRLKNLTLYALKAFGGRVKTALVTLWIGKSGQTLKLELKPGTDLVEIQKTHPHVVRVKYEPNLQDSKAGYEKAWETYQTEREAEFLKCDGEPSPETIKEINIRMDARWKKLLEEANLPDCFDVSVSDGTEYLRIK